MATAEKLQDLTGNAQGAYRRQRYEAAIKYLEEAKAVLSHSGLWEKEVEIAARVEALLRIMREKAAEAD